MHEVRKSYLLFEHY